MDIGDAKLKISVEGAEDANKKLAGIGTSITDMSKQFKIAGAAITGFGVAVAGSLLGIAKTFGDYGDSVQKAALRTGLTTEAVSELTFAAERSGASFSDVEIALKMLSRTMLDANEGMDTATEAFKRVGLSAKELKGLSPEAVFDRVATAIASIPDPMQRSAAALDLFGRSGTNLLPMLAGGSAGIQALRDRAKELGIVLDQEAADKAAAFNDALFDLKESLKGLMISVGPVITGVIMPMVESIIKVVTTIGQWVKENAELVKIGVIFAGIAAALALIIGPMLLLIGFLPSLMAGFAMIAPIAGVFISLLGPIALVIAGIAALAAAVYLVVANWESIKGFFVTLWEGIKAVFWAVVDWVKEWGILFIGPLGVIIKYWDKILSFFQSIPERIRGFFSGLAEIIKKPFITAINWIVDKINWLIEQINKLPIVNIGKIGLIGQTAEMPTMAMGGIVPGPIGQPIPILAHGGEAYAGIGSRVGNTYNITIQGTFLEGNESKWREMIRRVSETVAQEHLLGATP